MKLSHTFVVFVSRVLCVKQTAKHCWLNNTKDVLVHGWSFSVKYRKRCVDWLNIQHQAFNLSKKKKKSKTWLGYFNIMTTHTTVQPQVNPAKSHSWWDKSVCVCVVTFSLVLNLCLSRDGSLNTKAPSQQHPDILRDTVHYNQSLTSLSINVTVLVVVLRDCYIKSPSSVV